MFQCQQCFLRPSEVGGEAAKDIRVRGPRIGEFQLNGGDGFASFGQGAHAIQSLFEVLSDVRSGVGGADDRPQFSVGLPAHEGTEICERVDQNGLALGFQFLDGDGLPEIRCGHGLPSKQTPAEKTPMDNTAVETLYRFRRTNFTAVVMGLGGLAITGRSHR